MELFIPPTLDPFDLDLTIPPPSPRPARDPGLEDDLWFWSWILSGVSEELEMLARSSRYQSPDVIMVMVVVFTRA